jgi:hypothetical protein
MRHMPTIPAFCRVAASILREWAIFSLVRSISSKKDLKKVVFSSDDIGLS